MLGFVFVIIGLAAVILIVSCLIRLKMKTKELKVQNGRKRELVIFLPIAGKKLFLKGRKRVKRT